MCAVFDFVWGTGTPSIGCCGVVHTCGSEAVISDIARVFNLLYALHATPTGGSEHRCRSTVPDYESSHAPHDRGQPLSNTIELGFCRVRPSFYGDTPPAR